MKKSMLSVLFSAVLISASLPASAQNMSSQAVGGSIPRPQAVGGSIPRPQAVGGSIPRPQSFSLFDTVMTSFFAYFGL